MINLFRMLPLVKLSTNRLAKTESCDDMTNSDALVRGNELVLKILIGF